ncbi:hypothetical protein LCGC14_2979690, partial [marine sediment metagenome]
YIPPIPNSIFNDAFFNGGWMDGGVSIIDGDIYAQTGYFYNISALDVTELHVNGSISPLVGYDNIFDLGNSSMRWRDLYLGGQVYSNGTGDNWFLGNVGIGTASPDNSLHIENLATRTVLELNSDQDTRMYFNDRNDGNKFAIGRDNTDNAFKIAYNSDDFASPIMTVLSTGNVGIGTTSPDQKLEVVGLAQVSHTDGAGDHLTIQPFTDGNTYFNAYGIGADEGGFVFRVDDGATAAFKVFGKAMLNTLVLTEVGAGIGTASPYSGLHYQGDIFYLTPNAGADSNDNITIKNYATSNGAPNIILKTADISGAYGIGVGMLSLIGGSKTTHYGGIGGGGGKISLQGGRGRDSANNPSSYAPILLQSNGG